MYPYSDAKIRRVGEIPTWDRQPAAGRPL